MAVHAKQEVRSLIEPGSRNKHYEGEKKKDVLFTLEADGGDQVLVGGDCVQTLPVPQLPDLTGVIATSCRQVIPEGKERH